MNIVQHFIKGLLALVLTVGIGACSEGNKGGPRMGKLPAEMPQLSNLSVSNTGIIVTAKSGKVLGQRIVTSEALQGGAHETGITTLDVSDFVLADVTPHAELIGGVQFQEGKAGMYIVSAGKSILLDYASSASGLGYSASNDAVEYFGVTGAYLQRVMSDVKVTPATNDAAGCDTYRLLPDAFSGNAYVMCETKTGTKFRSRNAPTETFHKMMLSAKPAGMAMNPGIAAGLTSGAASVNSTNLPYVHLLPSSRNIAYQENFASGQSRSTKILDMISGQSFQLVSDDTATAQFPQRRKVVRDVIDQFGDYYLIRQSETQRQTAHATTVTLADRLIIMNLKGEEVLLFESAIAMQIVAYDNKTRRIAVLGNVDGEQSRLYVIEVSDNPMVAVHDNLQPYQQYQTLGADKTTLREHMPVSATAGYFVAINTLTGRHELVSLRDPVDTEGNLRTISLFAAGSGIEQLIVRPYFGPRAQAKAIAAYVAPKVDPKDPTDDPKGDPKDDLKDDPKDNPTDDPKDDPTKVPQIIPNDVFTAVSVDDATVVKPVNGDAIDIGSPLDIIGSTTDIIGNYTTPTKDINPHCTISQTKYVNQMDTPYISGMVHAYGNWTYGMEIHVILGTHVVHSNGDVEFPPTYKIMTIKDVPVGSTKSFKLFDYEHDLQKGTYGVYCMTVVDGAESYSSMQKATLEYK